MVLSVEKQGLGEINNCLYCSREALAMTDVIFLQRFNVPVALATLLQESLYENENQL